jgi:hypothetical protein
LTSDVIATAIIALISAALVYFVSSGRNWARLIYAGWLAVATVSEILLAPVNWQSSEGLITAISYVCDYVAMYWLFTEPGRRWFKS